MILLLNRLGICVLLISLSACWQAASLSEAVSQGDLEAVKQRLVRGADPNESDESGKPVLVTAVLNSRIEIVQALIAAGANVETKYAGITPLFLATIERRCDLSMMEALLDAGARTDVRTPFSQSTPLLEAAAIGSEECVNLLLEHGADPTAKTAGQETLLHNAVLGGNRRIVEKVTDISPINVNAIDSHGVTALIVAAAVGHRDIAQHLLQLGANPCMEDKRGRVARDVAIENDHDLLARMFPACASAP